MLPAFAIEPLYILYEIRAVGSLVSPTKAYIEGSISPGSRSEAGAATH
jgi:hypothetical protein